jgi:chaperone protein EcpD
MTYTLRHVITGLLLCAALLVGRAEAAVVINHTRVVYPAEGNEVTVQLSNKGNAPSLVRVWVDAGDEKSTPENAKVPFVITPPLFRLDAGKSGAVRVMYTDEPLPSDKESLFFLNVLDVPPKSNGGRNMLEFAVRSRIKLFFRPTGLPGNAAGAAHKLTWKLIDADAGKGYALQATNPTPYYVNFAKIGLIAGEQSFSTTRQGGMVAPGGTTVFPIKDLIQKPSGDLKARVNVIGDSGAIQALDQALAP